MLAKCQDQAVMQQDINEKEAQKSLHKDLRQYWATQQRVEDSRDAALKCGLKGAFEITIPEAKLGPASMQIFQVRLLHEASALCALRPVEEKKKKIQYKVD